MVKGRGNDDWCRGIFVNFGVDTRENGRLGDGTGEVFWIDEMEETDIISEKGWNQ